MVKAIALTIFACDLCVFFGGANWNRTSDLSITRSLDGISHCPAQSRSVRLDHAPATLVDDQSDTLGLHRERDSLRPNCWDRT